MEGVQGGGGQDLAWGFAEPQKPEEGRGRKCEGLSKEELISMLDLEEVCQNPSVRTCPPLSGLPCQNPHTKHP